MILVTLFSGRSSRGQESSLAADFLAPRLVLNGQGHTASLRGLAFSSDEKYLFSGGLDKVVHAWEFRDGKPRLDRSIRPPIRRTTGVVYALAISPVVREDGQRLLAIAGRSVLGPAGRILVYRFPGRDDRPAGDLAFDLPDSRKWKKGDDVGHAGAVNGLAFSPNGRFLASCGEDKTVRIWDVLDEQHHHVTLSEHTGRVRRVAFFDQRAPDQCGRD